MNCKKAQKSIPRYLDACLPKQEARQLEDHLESCLQCKGLYQRLSQALISFASQKITEPDAFFSTRVMAKIEAMHLKDRYRAYPRFSLKPALQAVAVAAAIFAGVMFGLNLSHTNNAYDRQDYIQALGETHYLFENDYTLESMFLTDNMEDQ